MPLRRVAVTGGGTAGHVLPAIPVIKRLLAAGCEVHFVGGAAGPERRLLETVPAVRFHAVSVGKLRRYASLENLADCYRVAAGVAQAWRLLRRLAPQALFSKGGFASFPAVAGAWLNRIPVVAHESDLTPGLANRLALPFAASLCVTFERTAATVRRKRVVVTGTPLRAELLGGDADRGRAMLGIDDALLGGRQVLLVVGGSLGAAALNAAVAAALDELLVRYVVVHVRGADKLDAALAGRRGYVQREYVRDGWGDVVAAADLVVSRAGANSLVEWLALGKPHLLVPLPKTASRGDQLENAAFAEAQGWSLVIEERALDASTLLRGLAKLARSAPAIRRRLATFGTRDSARLIVDELERVARP